MTNPAITIARSEIMAVQNQKACPRCNGLMLIKLEAGGWFEECARCGERNNISELVTVNTVGQIKILDRTEIKQNPAKADNPERV
jgi:DNA-directed RNA polymerase subunit M/transcription elongation factor TFIIS